MSDMSEEDIQRLALRLQKQFEEFGLIEGGKGFLSTRGKKKPYGGKKEGFDAAQLVAKRSLIGMRKLKSSSNSDVLTVHQQVGLSKENEWTPQAQLMGKYGEQFIANFLFLAELDSEKSEIPNQDNYYHFIAPIAGFIRRIKLLGQGTGGATAELHLLSKQPTSSYNPITDNRYNIADISAIDISSVAGTGWVSVYDSPNVDTLYINDDRNEANFPKELMYAYIVPNAGAYIWWLRVWIDTRGW